MKLITLNTWGARVKGPFFDFIKKYRGVDIFCFQEVYEKAEEKLKVHYPEVSYNLFSELKKMLPDYDGYFRPAFHGIYGIAVFIKKDFKIFEEGDIIVHDNSTYTEIGGHHSRNLQWIKFELDGKKFTVMNVHGLWNGKGKTDTPERISQSKMIKEFVNKSEDPKILCGDFNLNPDTESIKIIEEGMDNLIKKHSIKSTRTSLYTKPEKFADYVFISPDIKVKDFKVLPDEVSDHSALFLEVL